MPQMLDYIEAQRILEKYGIKTAQSKYVKSAKEAVSFSGGKPIVLKVISQKAVHKSKNGLVIINLRTPKEVESAFLLLSERAKQFKPYKMLAQEMARNGVEIIVGGKLDQQFGKLILLGLGGIYVEAFKDFALRVCPIKPSDADSMIDQLRSRNIIAPNDKERRTVRDLLLKTSKMLVENEMQELDINPVILHGGSYEAVDVRVIV